MKQFIQFPYEPHSAKAEDKQIRAFNDQHDPDDPWLTAWNVFQLFISVVGSILFVTSVLYLICQIKAVSNFLRDLDGMTGFWTIFTLACVAGVIIVRSARKQFRK